MLDSLYMRTHSLSKKQEVSFPSLLLKHIVAVGPMTIAASNLLWWVGGAQGDSHLATALRVQFISAQVNNGRLHIHHSSRTSLQGKENTWNVPSTVSEGMQEWIIINIGILEY